MWPRRIRRWPHPSPTLNAWGIRGAVCFGPNEMADRRWNIWWRLAAALAGTISLPAIVLVVRLLIWVFTEGSIEFEGDEFAEWVDSILRTIWISAAVGAVVGFVLPRVGLAFFLLFWSFPSVEIS